MNILDDRILQNFHILLVANDDFSKSINQLRQRLKSDDDFRPLFVEREKLGVFIKEINKLDDVLDYETSVLAAKYNLSSAYHGLIKSYLETGRPSHFFGLHGPFEPFLIDNPNNIDEKIVVLSLPPELTISELQKNWKHITSARKYLYECLGTQMTKLKKLSPRENTMRDIDIYYLKNNGYKAKEITKKINEWYPNNQVTYEDISKIIKRLKTAAELVISGQAK